jgi:DNA transformation protein
MSLLAMQCAQEIGRGRATGGRAAVCRRAGYDDCALCGGALALMSNVSRQFQDFILDLLAPLDPVARRMFSGVGLFHGGAMFGLLVRDAVYLRVDDGTRGRFEQAGSTAFSYMRGDRRVSIAAYYAVPEGLLDQPDELLQWARDAIGAARAVKRRR